MTVPVSYSVRALYFKPQTGKDPLATFRRTYKTLTAEELAELRANMEKGLKAKLDAGEIDQETYDLAQEFGGVAGKAVYEDVPGIGTAAAWGGIPVPATPAAAELQVLDGDFSFYVSADMGTREKSKATAIAVAKSILARCD